MKVTKGLFSSNTDNWATPQWLFDELNKIFHFTLDVCASEDNHKCDKYFTKETDGLKQDWGEHVIWCNPPYGREIVGWVNKCSKHKGVAVMLLPARTDTKWWQEYIYHNPNLLVRGHGSRNKATPFPILTSYLLHTYPTRL